MSTLTNNAREALDNKDYERAYTLAAIAHAEAAERQAEMVGMLLAAMEQIIGPPSEGSLNVLIIGNE